MTKVSSSRGHDSRNKHKSDHRPFEGSNPQMKGSYYIYNPEQPAVDQYQETTDKLIDVVCSSFKEPQLLKASIKKLTKQTITEPQLQLSNTTGAAPVATKQTRWTKVQHSI